MEEARSTTGVSAATLPPSAASSDNDDEMQEASTESNEENKNSATTESKRLKTGNSISAAAAEEKSNVLQKIFASEWGKLGKPWDLQTDAKLNEYLETLFSDLDLGGNADNIALELQGSLKALSLAFHWDLSHDAIKQLCAGFARAVKEHFQGGVSDTQGIRKTYIGDETVLGAWSTPFEETGAVDALLQHLEQQRAKLKQSNCYPCFSILQSSGYGKSRMIEQLLQTTQPEDRLVVYLSFAPPDAHPSANTTITGLKGSGREVVEDAFRRLFDSALQQVFNARSTGSPANVAELKFELKRPDGGKSDYVSRGQEVLFCIDEISETFRINADSDVSFFRCFRKAARQYYEMNQNCFFVLLSTFSSASLLNPSWFLNPSFRTYFPQTQDDHIRAMTPFLLHQSLGTRQNAVSSILEKPVEECLEPGTLVAMGRPIWAAYMNNDRARATPEAVMGFALAKLLLSKKGTGLTVQDLNTNQLLALLACRACLTISPVSVLAPQLVAAHMATAVAISDDGTEVVVSYPSEPVLALASRSYFKAMQGWGIVKHALSQLKSYLLAGAVDKGHRGEVIVRLLNILAMDKCMADMQATEAGVMEVPLPSFLEKFDRTLTKDGHEEVLKLSECLNPTHSGGLTPKQQRTIRAIGGIESLAEAQHAAVKEATTDAEYPFSSLEEYTVCFTHFVALSKDAKITPSLLQYAYRRTAALVVNPGRRGIDWIIPLRKKRGAHEKEDEFIGFVGQDKNRLGDTLDSLSDIGSPETHHKVTAEYFLAPDEKAAFETAGYSLNWPAVIFAIGSDDVGAAVARAVKRKRRCNNAADGVETYPFPCLVLTGLCYCNIMTNEANRALEELREIQFEPGEPYKEKVPLAYWDGNESAH